jgi:3-dehydroquinate dehydratase
MRETICGLNGPNSNLVGQRVNWRQAASEWRSKSIMPQVVTGTIAGLGVHGHELAVQHLLHRNRAARR